MAIPLLVVVNGLPCTGKTTVGRRIAHTAGLPCLHKDTIKEIVFDTLGWSDRNWSRSVSRCAFEMLFCWLETGLQAGCSLVVEGNFRQPEHAARFEALRQRVEFTLVEVLCKAEGRVLWQRFRRRAGGGGRHPGHVDAQTFDELKPRLLQGTGKALGIADRCIEIDTTDFALSDLRIVLEAMAKLQN